jgi:hypothetical protein
MDAAGKPASSEPVGPIVEPEKKEGCWDRIKGFGLVLWDGTGSFGTDYHKLNRVRGRPVTYCTKLENIVWVITNVLWIICAVYILNKKIRMLGLQK